MVTRSELLGMTPRQAYRQARQDGIHVAQLTQNLGLDPRAVQKWYQRHPEYRGKATREHVAVGEEEVVKERLNQLSHLDPRLPFVAINVGPKGTDVINPRGQPR